MNKVNQPIFLKFKELLYDISFFGSLVCIDSFSTVGWLCFDYEAQGDKTIKYAI